MNVLIVKNVAHEGPGTIEDYLKEQGIEYTILDFSDCKAEIPDIGEYTHLVIMGGPMAVYEADGHPFLHYEVAMIRSFIKSGKAVLGICLGAQIIAHALKANVCAGGTEVIGWDRVEITPEGMEDPVFSTLSVNSEPYADVFQWHGDTFDLPKKTVRLSSSKVYQNKAFRYGDKIYALQFHIEVKPQMIKEWFGTEEKSDVEKILQQDHGIFPEYRKRAFHFYEKFFH